MTQRASPLLLIAIFGLLAASSQAFWSGDDSKYIKKFAMMKVYESCFGDEVVREVRDEMRSAAARCAAAAMSSAPGSAAPTTAAPEHGDTEEATVRPQRPYHETTRRPPVVASSPNLSAESLLRLQALLQGLRTQGGANLAAGGGLSSYPAVPQQPQQHFRPSSYPGAYPEMHAPAFNPAAPGYGGGYGAAPSPYYYPHMPSPYYPHYHPYSAYMQRSSRDMRGGPVRIRNVTCVMQELGYLDANLEPNYAGIVSRIERLPLPIELRNDMTDAVHFCQKFSQCVPEPDQDKMQVSSEFTKPMIFFRCYKQKKLEACVLKDVRERFMSQTSGSGSEDPEIPDNNGIDEDEAEASGVLRGAFRGRSGRAMKTPSRTGAGAELADLVLNEDSFAL